MYEDDEIIGFDALWDSSLKCKNGVMWKDSPASFIHNGIEQNIKLHDELVNGTYRERPHKYFTVTEPKKRDVMSIAFRDRVYQRSLNDNAIYRIMSRSFIRDNCACQRGKGTDDCRDRLECFLHWYYHKHGNKGFILQCDIKGYYPNMRHDVAKAVFEEKLPHNVYVRAAEILDGFPGDTGYNPGSQIIQIAGISVPNELDHRVKEIMLCKLYRRYMDDFDLISNDKSYLESCQKEIGAYLAEKGFQLHPVKTKIRPLSDGIRSLGFIYSLTDSGKVLKQVPPEKVKHERKKLFRLVEKAKRGEIPRDKPRQCYESWRAHAEKGTTHKLLVRMDKYFADLWRDDNGHLQKGDHDTGRA